MKLPPKLRSPRALLRVPKVRSVGVFVTAAGMGALAGMLRRKKPKGLSSEHSEPLPLKGGSIQPESPEK